MKKRTCLPIALNTLVLLSSFLIITSGCREKTMTWEERLHSLPATGMTRVETDTFFTETWEVMLTQPVDHKNPGGKTFDQQIFVSYIDPMAPVVVITEGYNGSFYRSEMASILKCNQIIIEHRYFEDSRPDTIDWQYLTGWQAATDHHRIIELFKPVFRGKWITTGISKGGETVMYHSYYYPKDVDVRVPYVGPLAYAPEDPRIYEFLDNVGTQECRDRIYAFQKMMLERRDTFFPMMLDLSARMGWTFQRVGGAESAFEMAVLEYDFAYWQWGRTPCENIPLESTDEEIFRHFARIGDFSYFSDQGIEPIEPFFYQALTEQGYYGYRFDRFEGLLNHVSDSEHPDFLFSAPQGIEMTFNPDHNKRVYDYLYNKGNNFIYIYGADDTWTATGVEMSGSPTNSLVIKKEGGDHTTRIMNLEESDREVVLTKLSEWLSISIDTLRSNVSSIRRR